MAKKKLATEEVEATPSVEVTEAPAVAVEPAVSTVPSVIRGREVLSSEVVVINGRTHTKVWLSDGTTELLSA